MPSSPLAHGLTVTLTEGQAAALRALCRHHLHRVNRDLEQMPTTGDLNVAGALAVLMAADPGRALFEGQTA